MKGMEVIQTYRKLLDMRLVFPKSLTATPDWPGWEILWVAAYPKGGPKRFKLNPGPANWILLLDLLGPRL